MPGERCLACMKPLVAGATRCPNCGSSVPCPANPPDSLQPGYLLGNRFVIGKVIWRGRYSISYIAFDNRLQTTRCIKEYFPQKCRRRPDMSLEIEPGREQEFQRFSDRFIQEAQIMSSLSEKRVSYVVSVFDKLNLNGTTYILMEYLDGCTLDEFVTSRRKGLPWREAVRDIKAVLQTLEEIHQHGYLHRDISLSNIFRTQDGNVRVIDFGSAEPIETAKNHPGNMWPSSKRYYSPEEQITNRAQGPWTDIYAVGACLFKAVAGGWPSNQRNGETYPPLRSLGFNVPEGLDKIINRATQPEPKRRYSTAAAMMEALNRIEDDELVNPPVVLVDPPIVHVDFPPAGKIRHEEWQEICMPKNDEWPTTLLTEPDFDIIRQKEKKKKKLIGLYIAITAVAVISAVIVIVLQSSKRPEPDDTPRLHSGSGVTMNSVNTPIYEPSEEPTATPMPDWLTWNEFVPMLRVIPVPGKEISGIPVDENYKDIENAEPQIISADATIEVKDSKVLLDFTDHEITKLCFVVKDNRQLYRVEAGTLETDEDGQKKFISNEALQGMGFTLWKGVDPLKQGDLVLFGANSGDQNWLQTIYADPDKTGERYSGDRYLIWHDGQIRIEENANRYKPTSDSSPWDGVEENNGNGKEPTTEEELNLQKSNEELVPELVIKSTAGRLVFPLKEVQKEETESDHSTTEEGRSDNQEENATPKEDEENETIKELSQSTKIKREDFINCLQLISMEETKKLEGRKLSWNENGKKYIATKESINSNIDSPCQVQMIQIRDEQNALIFISSQSPSRSSNQYMLYDVKDPYKIVSNPVYYVAVSWENELYRIRIGSRNDRDGEEADYNLPIEGIRTKLCIKLWCYVNEDLKAGTLLSFAETDEHPWYWQLIQSTPISLNDVMSLEYWKEAVYSIDINPKTGKPELKVTLNGASCVFELESMEMNELVHEEQSTDPPSGTVNSGKDPTQAPTMNLDEFRDKPGSIKYHSIRTTKAVKRVTIESGYDGITELERMLVVGNTEYPVIWIRPDRSAVFPATGEYTITYYGENDEILGEELIMIPDQVGNGLPAATVDSLARLPQER